MWITRIQLKRVRGFRDLDLRLTAPNHLVPRRVTLIIGRNGTRKTTLLRAIAVGVCDYPDASDLLSRPIAGILAEGADQGEITLQLSAGDGEGSANRSA